MAKPETVESVASPSAVPAEFRLLGPVRVCANGRVLNVGPLQRQLVLAVLMLGAGQPVPMDTLIDRVWGERPPAEARSGLFAHFTRIRRVLAELDEAGGGRAELVRQPCGYQLDIDPQRVDIHRFRRLLSAADETDDAHERAQLLRAALDLVDGVPLAGLTGAWANGIRQSLCSQRLQALLDWGRAELERGRSEVVITELTQSAPEYPLAEPLIALRMRALHAAGQPAEALVCYERARQRLREELGADPATELADLHAAILRGDRIKPTTSQPTPPTEGSPLAPVDPPDQRICPAQLPGDVSSFTGRHAELAWLDATLACDAVSRDQADRHPGAAPAIGLICGTAGVGKTALALHWAHHVRSRFPDGQLFADLRGYDPDAPAAPADVLAGFLRALGVEGPAIPCDLDGRAATYRTLLSRQRVLIVLDNVGSAEQVRSLLPGTPTCATLVTSRDQLAALVARHGAHRLDLALLPDAEATTLMRALIGERALAEPAAVVRLIQRCARLPLALRVAAELATTRGGVTLAELAEELAVEERRLELLDAHQDQRTGLGAVFSWSYRQLPPLAARAFRLLGLHPGPDWGASAVAALTGTDLSTARTALGALARTHLVQATVDGRYGMHDLLRAYARGLAHERDSMTDRRAALTGLVDYYVAAATSVVDLTSPRARPARPTPVTYVPMPDATTAAAARAWLDTERAVLVGLLGYAADHGHPARAVQLAELLWDYLDSGGHFNEALAAQTAALRAAQAAADPIGQAHALLIRGTVLSRWGRDDEGAESMREAVHHAQRIGAAEIEARALHNLAVVAGVAGQPEEALRLLEQALEIWHEIGDHPTEAATLGLIGMSESDLGRHDAALAHLKRALEYALLTADRRAEGEVRDTLGYVLDQAGRHAEAIEELRHAIRVWREIGSTHEEMMCVINLGAAYWKDGRPREALGVLRQALKYHRDHGNDYEAVTILNDLGHACRTAGHPFWAIDLHQRALREASPAEIRMEQAKAQDGIARALIDLGRVDEAREHWINALRQTRGLSHNLASQIRDQLAALDTNRSGSPKQTTSSV